MVIIGGDGCDTIVLPQVTINRVGFARSPEAIATIKLHVEQDYCPSKYRPSMFEGQEIQCQNETMEVCPETSVKKIPLIKLTNKETPQLLFYQ